MKIEKISDTQLRCILYKQDLTDRELKISELAYGSEKTKALFSELMLQASYECGFDAENMPLVVEAIPVSSECLILLVTKVADPEELDSRFSRMSPMPEDMEDKSSDELPASSFADEIIECFDALQNILNRAGDIAEKKQAAKNSQLLEDKKEAKKETAAPVAIFKCFSFTSFTELCRLAEVINPYYNGSNSLYKSEESGKYFLVLNMSKHTPEEFNKVCNVATEYGTPIHTRYATLSYYDEHFTPIIKRNAVKKLTLLRNH